MHPEARDMDAYPYLALRRGLELSKAQLRWADAVGSTPAVEAVQEAGGDDRAGSRS